jgi:putative transposase
MRFALIDGAKAEFPVHRLCRVLGVSQSGYFAWRGRLVCRRQRDDMVLLAHVRSALALSNGTYGSPRMTRELRDGGLTVGRRRIARLMPRTGSGRGRSGGSSGRPTAITPGRSRRTCSIRTSQQRGPTGRWAADISYVWTREGWLYLTVVIDLFARPVVGWLIACLGNAWDRVHGDRRPRSVVHRDRYAANWRK